MGKEDHRKSNLCYTFDGEIMGNCETPRKRIFDCAQ